MACFKVAVSALHRVCNVYCNFKKKKRFLHIASATEHICYIQSTAIRKEKKERKKKDVEGERASFQSKKETMEYTNLLKTGGKMNKRSSWVSMKPERSPFLSGPARRSRLAELPVYSLWVLPV